VKDSKSVKFKFSVIVIVGCLWGVVICTQLLEFFLDAAMAGKIAFPTRNLQSTLGLFCMPNKQAHFLKNLKENVTERQVLVQATLPRETFSEIKRDLEDFFHAQGMFLYPPWHWPEVATPHQIKEWRDARLSARIHWNQHLDRPADFIQNQRIEEILSQMPRILPNDPKKIAEIYKDLSELEGQMPLVAVAEAPIPVPADAWHSEYVSGQMVSYPETLATPRQIKIRLVESFDMPHVVNQLANYLCAAGATSVWAGVQSP
jgi:hypothetical protein